MTDPVTTNIVDATFTLPATITDPMYAKVQPLTAASLTTGVGGTGIFDAIMASMGAQLQDQFETGRITGSEYTKVYIAMFQAALQFSVQFALGKDQAFWQAQQAQIEAITARMNMEKARYDFLAAQYNFDTILPLQSAGMTLDNTNKTNEAAIQTYNLNTILPLQAAGATTANSIASYQLNTLLPLESDKATLDNSIATYNLNTMLPSQQLLVHEQMETAHAQTCNVRLDNNQTVTGAIGSQTTLMAVQTTVATEQAAQTTYTIANILPEQAKLIHEQMEVQHAQTCEVRLDNSETVTGLIGGQKSLYAQQVTSYQRDAEVKAVKIFTDAWITQKTMDDTTLPPTNFTNVALDEILSTIMTNNALGTPLAHV